MSQCLASPLGSFNTPTVPPTHCCSCCTVRVNITPPRGTPLLLLRRPLLSSPPHPSPCRPCLRIGAARQSAQPLASPAREPFLHGRGMTLPEANAGATAQRKKVGSSVPSCGKRPLLLLLPPHPPPREPLTTCAVEQCCLPGWGLISASAQRSAVCRAAAPVYDDSLDKDPRLRISARQELRDLGDLDFVRGLIFFLP